MAKPADIKGQRFGKLTAVHPFVKRDKSRGVRWFCQCDCGGSTVASVGTLRSGNTKTCGCSWWDEVAAERTRKRSTRHGQYKSLTYRSWAAMRHRCQQTTIDPNNRKYYVAYGTTVCKRWDKFENFLEDMGQRPSRKPSIDRINPYGNYEPTNCRWATSKEQRANRRETDHA